MAKTELFELESIVEKVFELKSIVEKVFELKSIVEKDFVLQSLITGDIETILGLLTFDDDKTYINSEGLIEDPDWKVRLEGNGTAIQAGRKLILSAFAASSDIAFIEKQEDLRGRVKWKIRFQYKHTGPFGLNNLMQIVIRNSLAVVGLTNNIHWNNVTAKGRLRMNAFGTNVAPNLGYNVQRKDINGITQNEIFIFNQWAGQEVISSIERLSDRYRFIHDELAATAGGTQVTDVFFVNIRAPFTKDFIQIAASARIDNPDSKVEFNFIDLQTVA